MKNKILQVRFILVLFVCLIIIATPVIANEIIKFNQFNHYLKQAQDLNSFEKPQKAQEALEQAKRKIHATFFIKTLKNKEIKQTEKEIEELRQLIDERVKKAINENLKTLFPIPTSKPTLTLTPIPTSIPIPLSENKQSYVYDSYYPIILSLSDNKGGKIRYSYNNQYPYETNNTGITLKVGDNIRWEAEASDPEGRQILYQFSSNSQRFMDIFGRGQYKTENCFEYTISEEDLKDAGETLRIVLYIKSEKNNYRRGNSGFDDGTFLDYKLQSN